ncbi:class A beta-lactamase-related serine hydrolase [Flavobacterium cupreum]|uniref:Class A beta-lactamase-related serine hydrolase n=1 Tax=Flavobacterium cupreum TaxID=2133766 RepID=A0A434A1U7_9FLAO|nr:serine hydrolase domain-containing protein [Flavobacterium cupreum]RUT68360.1 class A beta-lactamase-related serine hydrolase [Flavobacterium cupreum]
MLKFTLLLSIIIIQSFTSCIAQSNTKIINESNTEIDQYISQIQERYEIPGISLAIVKNRKIIHRNNYGKASVEQNVAVSDKSIFRIYSLTKIIIATGVFQLIEQNKLSLEDFVSKYIQGLPNSWNSLQIKHLLTHSSGLPDIVEYERLPENEAQEKVFKDTIRFNKGEKFEYNQTNFWLLQKIIEKLSGQDIEKFIAKNQFDSQIANKNIFFSTDSRDIILNRTPLYSYYNTGHLQIDYPNNGNYLNSCNGINISMDEFIFWDKRFNDNKLINSKSKEKMWETFPYTKSDKKFALGWDETIVNGHISFGFSGGRVTAYRNFPKDNLSIIFLANGIGNSFDIENIVNHIAYLVDNDIVDYNSLAYESLLKTAQSNISDFKKVFTTLKNNPKYSDVDFEQQLNSIGYSFLTQNKKNSDAITIFILNTEEYPKSNNAFDSLGEAYEVNKDLKNAILNYNKSMELSTDEIYRSKIDKKIKELKTITNTFIK